MFEQDSEKVNKIIALAKLMQKAINSGKLCTKTVGWFEGWWSSMHCKHGSLRRHYKRNVYQNMNKQEWKDENYF